MKTRLEYWEEEKSIDLFIDNPQNDSIKEYLESINYKSEEILSSNYTIIQNAKELIFNFEESVPSIHVISQSLCLDTFKLKNEKILKFTYDNVDETNLFDEVKNTIALALALDIPVYPNTRKLEPELLKYYKNILEEGFTAPDQHGEMVKLRATNSKEVGDFKIENLNRINTIEYWSSLDLLFLRENLHNEFLKLNNAQRTLNYLEVAINKLESALSNENRNENYLQSILTENPILFGIEYSKIIPKHKLGSEYEMDYALEKFSGLIDLVEIESSNLKLFTKQGNPTKDLVHAEQQVIDWLNWIEKNNSYANSKVSGFISPKAFVIIGTNSEMSDKNKESLIRRNKLFNGTISILTYDDLLLKSKTIFEVLKKE